MIIEIIIVCIVSIPTIIYAFRRIKKVKSCCCSCEQSAEEQVDKTQPNSDSVNSTLMQYLINKFTPRKVPISVTKDKDVSHIAISV